MGYVAAQIFKRAIERNNKKSCCCCNCSHNTKPKRYTAEWSPRLSAWMISYKSPGNTYAMHCVPLDLNCDQHREAAERIAAIYEEVTP